MLLSHVLSAVYNLVAYCQHRLRAAKRSLVGTSEEGCGF